MAVSDTDTKVVEKRLLRLREAGQVLNLNKEIVRRMCVSGQLKCIRRAGLHTPWLIDIRELERWIEKHSVTRPTPRRW